MSKNYSKDLINKKINDLREEVFSYSYSIDENDKNSEANDKLNYRDEINLLRTNKKFFMCAGINHILTEAIRDLGINAYVYHYGVKGILTHSVSLVELNDNFYVHDAFLNRYMKNDLFSEIKILKNKPDHVPTYIYGKDLNKKHITKKKNKKFYKSINNCFYEMYPECKGEDYFITSNNIHDWINTSMISPLRKDNLKTFLYEKFNYYNTECLLSLPLLLSGINGSYEINGFCNSNNQICKEILDSITRL